MNLRRLREVADDGQPFAVEERCWCIGELTGLLADWSLCDAVHGLADQALARCLPHAWMESIRCGCA